MELYRNFVGTIFTGFCNINAEFGKNVQISDLKSFFGLFDFYEGKNARFGDLRTKSENKGAHLYITDYLIVDSP